MRSARRATRRSGLAAAAVLPLAALLGGCQTTQETAALKQAESKRILEARKQRQRSKSHDQGSGKR